MSVQNALASVAVTDLSTATSWYERVLEAPPTRPMAEVAEWHFEGGGGLQVYLLPERAGACSATLTVDDLDSHAAKLRGLNITTNRLPENASFKVLMIKDPDGNSIALAQPM